jgi:RRXRR protein/HNH endonuclease
MKVFVVSQAGKPLMPTTPGRARRWLKEKRARVICKVPFTVRLRFATQEYMQQVKVGVDTGSKVVGIAATTDGGVVFQAQVHLRDDIADKLTQRQQYRRTRRSRKTRYRPARWANRRRPDGWLPPSIRSKAEATIKAVRFVASFLPISQVNVEIAGFDTHKMQNPEVAGMAYQQGELFGYQLREYLLQKWQRKCAYCQSGNIPLQIEHIVPKTRGGSDRASNLTLACEACNVRKGTQTAEEFGYPEIQAQARIPLKDAAHVSSLKTAVVQHVQTLFGNERIHPTFGYETKYKRIQVLGLPKSHTNDAIAIACKMGEVVKPLETVYLIRCLPRGQYQRFNGPHSEHKCWAPRTVQGFKLYELVKAKGQIGYIAGRREKGAFVIKDVASGKKVAEITPRKLIRIARPCQGWLIACQPIQPLSRKEGGASSPR